MSSDRRTRHRRTRSAPGWKPIAAGGVSVLAAATLATLGTTGNPAHAEAPCGAHGVFSASPPTCTYTPVVQPPPAPTPGCPTPSALPLIDTFAVPDGVTGVRVALFGAEGGSAPGFIEPDLDAPDPDFRDLPKNFPPPEGAPGGLGGETRGTVAVQPGDVLQITVGEAGKSGVSVHGRRALDGGPGNGSGGGGGHGGGGSGGGASDVRIGAFGAADRILVAGGGGGAGTGGPQLRGGNGGGLTGVDGGQGGPEGSATRGTGATQTAHGAAGARSVQGAPGSSGADLTDCGRV
ncbi:MAG: glycine-rich protein, partial [Micromonosporaceae bacterium]